MNKPTKLYLASSSPQKIALMRELVGENFECVSPNYIEDNTRCLSPWNLTIDHAVGKTKDVCKQLRSKDLSYRRFVIGADTLVVYEHCDGSTVLGKAQTPEEARQYLQMLSGNCVSVITGYSTRFVDGTHEENNACISHIVFCKLSKEEIDAYIATGEPIGKAGGFAIQGKGRELMAGIDGSESNIIGLPTKRIRNILKSRDLGHLLI